MLILQGVVESTNIERIYPWYSLKDKRCLEIGSSVGVFQDTVEDYYGTDIAKSLAKHYYKPYKVAEGKEYPFDNEMFDAI